jgi:hypothetical protein
MWTGEAGVDGVEGVVEPDTARFSFGVGVGSGEAGVDGVAGVMELLLRARLGEEESVDGEARLGAEEGFNGGARWTGRCCVTPAPERVLPEFRRVVGIWRAGWVLGWMKPRGWGIRLS